jgi:hypothetical protein
MSEDDDKKRIAKRLDDIGWGLFFIWVGIAVLADLGWGVGLLGVGILALAEQGIRVRMGLNVEVFWVVVGLLLVVGGGWEISDTSLSFVGAALIVAGAAFLVSALRGKGSSKGAD